jgi:hypothetical protein
MEQVLSEGGFTVYLTPDVKSLPSYGEDVIAVLQEDQPARVPEYFDDVLVTFTCHGIGHPLHENPITQPSLSSLLSTGRYARNFLLRLPGRIRHYWLRQQDRSVSAIHAIPLGYANQVDLSTKPIDTRPNDLFFAGSVEHSSNPLHLKSWIGTPKYYSRVQLVDSLKAIERDRSDIQVDLRVKDTYLESMDASAQTYSEGMMNAKICPVPRGTSLESFRFFEALRFGCIPVVEGLPSRWFYDEAPAIQVSDWNELGDIVSHLLRNPDTLRTKHAAVLEWWETQCSEQAVGEFMADKIQDAQTRKKSDSLH